MAIPSSRQSLSLRERGPPPSRRRSRPEYQSRPSDSTTFARDRQRWSPQQPPTSRIAATSRHRASPQRRRAESSSTQRYRAVRSYPDAENATCKSAPPMEPCSTRVQTSIAPNKRNTDRVLHERAEREKYDGERTPDSKKSGAYGLSGVCSKRRPEIIGVAHRRPTNKV